jgi:hypothetical protein
MEANLNAHSGQSDAPGNMEGRATHPGQEGALVHVN